MVEVIIGSELVFVIRNELKESLDEKEDSLKIVEVNIEHNFKRLEELRLECIKIREAIKALDKVCGV